MAVANGKRLFSTRLERFVRQVLLGIAVMLIGAPIVHDLMLGHRVSFHTAGTFSLVSGLAILLFSVVLKWLPAPMTKLALAAVAVTLFLAAGELLGRAAGHDFAKVQASWNATPIYFRQPVEPVDPVYFRRSGPDRWEGKVLTTELQRNRFHESDAYPNEESIVVEYDSQGLRNPSDLLDWEVAVVGDSFTELGYLPDDELTSSVLAKSLQRPVKNLGVSFTGTFNQTRLLEKCGIAEGTTDAVLVFFEGNDVLDTAQEFHALHDFAATGVRELRELQQQRQSSLLVALKGLFRIRNWRGRSVVNASCDLGSGVTDLTVTYTPAMKKDLDANSVLAVETALKKYSELVTGKGVRPWLVYMPCKRRVLDGHLKFREKCSPALVQWKETDMPEWIQRECEQREIRFLDLTPHLLKKTEQGELLFNTVYDTHLNSAGAAFVAEVISDAMRPVVESDGESDGVNARASATVPANSGEK